MAYTLTDEDRKLVSESLSQQRAPQAQAPQPTGIGGLGGVALDFLPFGRQAEKLLTGRGGEITGGELVTEGALSLLPFGIGKLAKVGKGLSKASKASKGADILKPTANRPAGNLQLAIENAHNAGDTAKVQQLVGQLPADMQAPIKSALGLTPRGEIFNPLTGKTFKSGQRTAPTKDLVSLEGAPDASRVAEYKARIENGGNIEPILVKPDSAGRLTVEDGKHRLEAFRQAGVEDVPIEVGPAARAIAEERPVGALSRVAERLMGKQTGIIPGAKVGSQQLTAQRAKQLNKHIETIGAKPSDAADTILRRNESFLRNQEQAIESVLDAKNTPLGSNAAEEILRAGKPPLGVDLASNETYRSLAAGLGGVKDLKGLNTFRRDVDDIINFSRSAASPDPVSERVALSFRKAISDFMGKKIPDLKPLNTAYGKAKDVETFIRPAAVNPGGIGAFGVKVGGRAMQGAAGTAGRALGAASGAGSAVGSALGSPAAKFLGQQAGVRAGADLLGVRGSEPTAEALPEPTPTNTTDAASVLGGSPSSQASITSGLQQAAIQALAQGDYEGIKAIKEVAALFPEEQASKLDASTRKTVTQANNALNVLDSVERAFDKAGGAKGAVGGTAANLLGSVRLNQDAKYYNDISKGQMARILRGLGEVGTLAEGDVQRGIDLLPNLADTPENAALKFEELRTLFSQAAQNAVTNGAGTGPDASSILSQYGL